MSAVNPPYYTIVNSEGIVLETISPQSLVGPALQVVITNSGSGYTPGSYNIPLSDATTPAATGIVAMVLVVGNVVSGVTITNSGNGSAKVGDNLVPSAAFGGGSGFICSVTAIPNNTISLEMAGANSLDWGQNLWTNLVRMTENFASPNAPGANSILGNTVSPLVGQLWFDTTSSALKVYTAGGWVTLETSGIASVTGTAPIVATTSGSTVNIALAVPGPTVATYTNSTISIDANGRVVSASSGAAPTGGTVTSVAASSTSSGLGVSGSPVTSTGTLVFTLNSQLNSLAGLGAGIVKSTGGAYTIASPGDITGALGYTPYNATNPNGYITTNKTITLSGAVSGSGTTAIATTLGANVVYAANFQQVPPNTVSLGNITGATANITGLSAAQVTGALVPFTATTQGVVPASGGGTTNVLLANGTWGAPAGSTLVHGATANLIRTGTSGSYPAASNAADPALSVSLAAGHVYNFKITCTFYAPSAGVFIGVGYTGQTVAGTALWGGYYNTYGGNGSFTQSLYINSQTSVFTDGIDTAGGLIIIEGQLYTTTAGSLGLTWGNANAGNNQMTRYAGGSITATLIV